MAVPDLVTHWGFYAGAGSVLVGVVSFGIGLGRTMAMQKVHGKNITSLWIQKKDKEACETEHKYVTSALDEIKSDVKEILKIKRNGG